MPEFKTPTLNADQIAEIKVSVRRKVYDSKIEIIEELMAAGDIAPDTDIVEAEAISRTQAFYKKAYERWQARADKCAARRDWKMCETNMVKVTMANHARFHCFKKYLK